MILSLFLPSLNVSNYHIADSIMTNLQTLNGCTCLVQYVHLSCPDSNLVCSDCVFNPLALSKNLPDVYIYEALNRTRCDYVLPQNFSPFKIHDC